MLDARLRRAFAVREAIVVLIVLILIIGFMAQTILLRPSRAHHNRFCRSALKGIGIASLLYGSDYRHFPHMKPLPKDQQVTDVTRVFESFFYLRYLDNPEALVCSSSDDEPILSSSQITANPKAIDLETPNGIGTKASIPPILRGPATPVLENRHVSFTYRRRSLLLNNASATQMLAGDEDYRRPNDPNAGGNHQDRFYLVFADGHCNFVPVNDKANVQKMLLQLIFEGSNAEADFGPKQTSVKPK